jgi:hypothetical protein
MMLPPWDPDNEMIETEWDKEPVTGTNWGLLLAVGGSLLFWAGIVFVASEMIAR